MPIYEYACAACGHEFEEWQKITDEPVRTCPKCKKRKVERLISQTAFQLKGGGWYSDLYASAKKGGDSKSEGKSEGGESGKAEGKSDAKSDANPGKSEPASADKKSGDKKASKKAETRAA